MSFQSLSRRVIETIRQRRARSRKSAKRARLRPMLEALERREVMAATVFISEVHPAGSGNLTYAADWFEVTNRGASAVDITGWKMDDSSNAIGTAVVIRGVTSIPAGKSAIFFEGNATGTTDATIIANFSTAWFGSSTPPAGFLIGGYGGAGVGLSTGGDAVNLFDAGGASVTGVSFGAANAARTFDNIAGASAVTTLSFAGVNSAFLASNGAETGSPGKTLSTVDLSTYVRIGRFDLPEPTRTAAPPNSLLAQEVSAVTYNWDTDTLFVVGDGGTSVVQVTKNGQLVDSMTLSPGGSPQGTEFYDPEGLMYIGGGKFVMVEERDRNAVLFTYVAGTTLIRDDATTINLGPFVPNIGIEGMSYDPQTGGYIAVKETAPQGIFLTEIDFAAGTATNKATSTQESTNLFDPALAGQLDFADIFALSNLHALDGLADSSRLLVLSQESGTIVNIDRAGNVFSTLTIVTDPGNPLSVPAQQHEGMTMDGNGFLYVVSENGGGDFDHPQLWVYAPSTVANQAPTSLALNNQVNSIVENTSTVTRIKVADVVVTDDGLGTNNLTVTGADAPFFEVDSTGLYIKAGTNLDFETQSSYGITVNVDDPTLGSTPDASATYSLTVTDVINEDPSQASLFISEVAPWSSGNSTVGADWFEVTNTGNSTVNIAGWKVDDNSNSFAVAVTLNGVTSIAPGESVIFIETNDLAGKSAAFLANWFGGSPPAGLQIGNYTGGGVGLSTGGDAVNLYNSGGALQANVTFGASSAGPFPTFDNAAGLNNTAISQLSVVGVHGAIVAANSASETGSPGTVGRLFISEVAPWSSGNSPVGSDWFEVTNTTAHNIDITGWKMDDSSGSYAASVALSGITTIGSGESVIFLETSDLAGKAAIFLSTWFGTNPPNALHIGNYTGGGVGLSTGGDGVNLYNSTGQLQASVTFGPSPAGPSFPTFDNGRARNNTSISQLSAVGVQGAFAAVNDTVEIGSPGTINNEPPVAGNDSVTTAEDTAVTFNVLGNDSDANGDSLTVISFTAASNGAVVNNGDGSFTYTPALHFNGSDNFTYTISDGNGRSATAIGNLTVSPVNDQPMADAKSVTTGENVPVDVTLSGSDVETPSGSLIFAISIQPQHGSLAVDGSHVVYTPEIGYHGPDSFRYTATDSGDGSSPALTSSEAVVSINVISADGQPVVFIGDDPLNPSQSALFVFGTNQDDYIEIDNSCTGRFEVEIRSRGVYFVRSYSGPFSRIVVYGQDGDDHIEVDDRTATQAWLIGGAGDDHLQGGTGQNLLLGGTGDDHLQAGRGRDILIGGIGGDHLQAGKGEDILIGGTTDYDASDAALDAILAEWNAGDDYLTRIAHLQSSAFAYRLTGSTVHDDGVSDQLQGGLGLDWYFAHLTGNKKEKDKVEGVKAGEVVTGI